jgi:hypothetical protein
VRDGADVLLVGGRTPGAASGTAGAHVAGADQTGEAVAAPPPSAAPGGPEGEGEEPAPPGSTGGRPGGGG